MRKTKHWLMTIAALLCSMGVSAATYSDWISTNKGQSSSTSSNTYTITANAGDVLTFDWLVSSESGWDKLIVTIGGTEILNKSGEFSGTYQHTFTSSGTYTMVVKYTKDGSVDRGSDYAKVYNITLGGTDNVVASGVCGDNLTWKLTDEGELRIEGMGEMYEYYRPWMENHALEIKSVTIGGGVTSVAAEAFAACANLTSVFISESVASIGYAAFINCSSLSSIIVNESNPIYDSRNNCNAIIRTATNRLVQGCSTTIIPEGVTAIGNDAFAYIQTLTSISIPSSVLTIESGAFRQSYNLTTVDLGNGLTTIKEEVFLNCNLESITLPASVTTIGSMAFAGCSNLSSITCKALVPPTCDDYGYILPTFDVALSIPVYVPQKSIGAYQQADVWKEFTNYQPIPPIIIASGTTYGGNLTWKLTDEGELTIEGEGEMNSCPWSQYESSIKSVVIGEGVTSICNYAFFNCTNLTSIDIPESVSKIGQYAFANTGWYDNQPEGLVYIGSCLYGYKGEMPENFELVVKEGTKGIADYAFESCSNLIMATIPESVSYIGRAAFMQSGLGLVLMSEGIESIGGGAFWGCYRLEEVSIPESVTEVGSEAFHNTAWYRKQPCGMLYLSGWALGSKNCWECEVCQKMNSQMSILVGTRGLASGCIPDGALSVIIPESVVYLSYEFAYGYRESIICKALVPPSGVNESTFNYITDNAVLYVPASAVNAYKADEHWGKFVNIQAIDFPVWTLTSEGELTIDGTGAMEDYGVECTPWAIYDEFIKSVTIKEGVTSVGNNAFAYCEKMESASLPNSLTSIGVGAFAECDNLKFIVIPENVTILGNAAFYGSGISQITCNAMTPPTIAEETFFYVSKSIPVYVPLNSVSSYRNASYWNEFTNIQAMPEYITINQYGSCTYCSPYALDFSEVEGLKAYVAAGYNSETGVVTLLRVMSAKAGVGLFVKGEPGDYVVPVLENTSYNALNLLVGTLEETIVNGTDGSYTNYKYTILPGNDEPMFYPFADGSTQGAGRAYLQIPTAWLTEATAKSISYRFDEGDGTTDIDNSEFTIQDSEFIYDLMGRRVANPTKGGIYIVNGKKTIIK